MIDAIQSSTNTSRSTSPTVQNNAPLPNAYFDEKKPQASQKASVADGIENSPNKTIPTSLPKVVPQTLPESTKATPEAPKSTWRTFLEAKINAAVEQGKAFVGLGKTTFASVMEKGRALLHEVSVFLRNFSQTLADIARGNPGE